MTSRQTGFTLVEIAVVLVIISLLMGGVLKGQELIDSAKVKNLAQDFRTTPALLHAYQDKFRALPGDDSRGPLHLCPDGSACTSTGNGNAAIDGDWDDDDTDDTEAFRFWQHVRLANLATGTADIADAGYLPRNAVGGRVGIQRGGSLLGLTSAHIVCSGNVPGKLVRQLDIALDDGNPASGSVRAGTAGEGGLQLISAGNPLVDGNTYTVCANL